MSLYSHKQAGTGVAQPWSQTITLAEAGRGCDGLFSLYDSQGDKTLVGANTIATLLDGPEKVVRYGALTLGDGTTPTSLTVANRCKGLVVLCDSLTVKNAATLHMTGRGPRVVANDEPFFPFIDFKIPIKISLDSSRMSLSQALAAIKNMGLAPWDAGTFSHVVAGLYGFNLGITLAGTITLLSVSGCGTGGAQSVHNTYTGGAPGAAGSSGGCGSGGHGGLQARTDVTGYWASHGKPGAGSPYGGGNATSGLSAGNGYGTVQDDISVPSTWTLYSWKVPAAVGAGAGGAGVNAAAGVPSPGWGGAATGAGGEGVGGKLTIICRGPITVQSGGKIEANGMPGGASSAAYGTGGGGSGGGHLSIISPAAPANSGTIQAAGGAGGAGPYGAGGAGGAGSVVTKTFSDMGW